MSSSMGRDFVWQYRANDGNFRSMDGLGNWLYEQNLKQGESSFQYDSNCHSEGRWHNIRVDLTNMTQTNDQTGTVRKIRRLEQTHA